MDTPLNLNDHFVAQFRELEAECERLRHSRPNEPTETRAADADELQRLREALDQAERTAAETKQTLTRDQARLQTAEQENATWRDKLQQERLEQQRVRNDLKAARDSVAALEEANGKLKQELETRAASPVAPPPLPAANPTDRRNLLVQLEELREEVRDLKREKMRLERELYQLKHA